MVTGSFIILMIRTFRLSSMNGRNDDAMGWTENPFGTTQQVEIIGGFFYFDNRDRQGSALLVKQQL